MAENTAIEQVWVAADPAQPGAAWALCDASEDYRKHAAKTVADWVRRGAVPTLVPREQGCEMLDRWVRPTKAQTTDLFGGA